MSPQEPSKRLVALHKGHPSALSLSASTSRCLVALRKALPGALPLSARCFQVPCCLRKAHPSALLPLQDASMCLVAFARAIQAPCRSLQGPSKRLVALRNPVERGSPLPITAVQLKVCWQQVPLGDGGAGVLLTRDTAPLTSPVTAAACAARTRNARPRPEPEGTWDKKF